MWNLLLQTVFAGNALCTRMLPPKKTWKENPALMRSVRSYDEAVSSIDASATGIECFCPLNELAYFHAATNRHSILQGVCAYDLRPICDWLIGDDYFTVATSNGNFQNLNYGYHDMQTNSSKPPVISSFDADILPSGVAEISCFTRHLAITIGEFVEPNNEMWLIHLLIWHIMDIIVSP